MTTRLLLPLALFCACSPSASEYDRDGDGVPNFDDCAPDDAAVYPGAEEVCDGIDNNCNTGVDEGLTQVFYADADGDGFGDPAVFEEGCGGGVATVLNDDDCDDANADVNPSVAERCNGVDDDCDEDVDEVFYTDDFSDELFNYDDLYLLGSATRVDDVDNNTVPPTPHSYVRLTPEDAQRAGALWMNDFIPGDVFKVTFRMRLQAATTFSLGEGVAFAITPSEVEEILADPGPRLGIYQEDVDGLTVEFDPRKNSDADTTGFGAHIAVHRIREVDMLLEDTSPPGFSSAGFVPVEITFRGNRIKVDVRGLSALDAEIPGYTPWSRVRLGWTAATSNDNTANQGVDDLWVGCPEYIPPDAGDTGDTGP